jgi:uncharacterized delta-60 repeat protein
MANIPVKDRLPAARHSASGRPRSNSKAGQMKLIAANRRPWRGQGVLLKEVTIRWFLAPLWSRKKSLAAAAADGQQPSRATRSTTPPSAAPPRASAIGDRRLLVRARHWVIAAAAAGALAALPSGAAAAPGDLDTRFGSGQGFLTTDVVPGNIDAANAVASDYLGRVWVAGNSGSDASGGIAVTRYDSQGLDTSFASGGKRVIAFGSGARGGDLLERSNPGGPGLQVLIAGSVVEGGVRRPLVAAIRENGDLDPGWADDGLLSHPVPGASSTELTAIAEQAGRIVVAGHATVNAKVYAFVARYTATGELDPTFSSDGMRVIPAWRPYAAGTSVQTEAVIEDVVFDGSRNRIVLVGMDFRSGDVNALTIGLRSTDGATDTSWGDRGLGRVFAFGSGSDWFNAAELAYDGKLVLAGGRNIPGTGKAAVTARLDTRGRLDLSYGGGNGVTRWHPGRDLDATDVAITGAFIVVATHDRGGTGGAADDDTFTILRYGFDGDADTTWGRANAEVRTNITPGGYERANALVQRPGGTVAVAGLATPGPSSIDYRFAVAYYHSS